MGGPGRGGGEGVEERYLTPTKHEKSRMGIYYTTYRYIYE